GVTRAAGARLLVRRILRVAAGVADGSRVDARGAPEDALGAPETAHADDRLLEPLGERRGDRGAEDIVLGGDGHLLVTAGECLVGLDHACWLREEEHASSVCLSRKTLRR